MTPSHRKYDYDYKMLERDLTRNATERLQTWVRDTVMRCEVGRLDPPDIGTMILAVLTDEMLTGYAAMNINMQDFLTLLQHHYAHKLREKAQEAKKST